MPALDGDTQPTDIGGIGLGQTQIGSPAPADVEDPLPSQMDRQTIPPVDPMSGVPQAPRPGLLDQLSGRLQSSAGIPPSQQVQSTYGGLMTGLAGLLIDGLAAGISTPPGKAGPALAAQRGMQMVSANRQRAAGEQAQAAGQMTSEQSNVVKSMDRHVKGVQMLPLVNGMSPDEQEAYMRPYVGAINQAVEDGYIKPISQSYNRSDVFNQLQHLRGKAGNDGAHMDIFPIGESNGQVQWMLGSYDPNQTIDKDMDFTLGGYMDEQGVFQTEPGTVKAGTKVGDALNYMQTAFTNHAHNISLMNEAKLGRGNAAAFQDAMFQRSQELIARRMTADQIANDPVMKGLQKAAEMATPASKARATTLAGMLAESVNDDINAGTGESDRTREILKYMRAQKSGDDSSVLSLAFNSYNRYWNDLKTNYARLTPDDIKALQVLATSDAHRSFGGTILNMSEGELLNLAHGEPMTDYSARLYGGIMKKDQWDKLSPAGQRLAADYSNSLMQAIAVARVRTKSSRPPQNALDVEMNTVPPPYVDPARTGPLFSNTIEDVRTLLGQTTLGAGLAPGAGAGAGTGGGQAPTATADSNEGKFVLDAQHNRYQIRNGVPVLVRKAAQAGETGQAPAPAQ